MVDNLRPTILRVVSIYGNSFKITLAVSSGKHVVTAVEEIDNINGYPKIIHSFPNDYNKTMTYFTFNTGNSVVGLSFETDSWVKIEDPLRASITNTNRKINTISGVKQISMNSISDFFYTTNYTRSTLGYVSSNGLCGSGLYYVWIGGFKQCVTACPNYYPKFEVSSNLERECVESCSGEYRTDVEDSKACLVGSCSAFDGNTYRYWINSSSNQCIKQCKPPYPYLNEDTCTNKCPSDRKFINSVSDFALSSEKGTCTSTCNAPQFQLVSSEYEYSANDVKYYCIDTCDKENYKKYYVDGLTQHCVNDCRVEHSTNTMVPNKRYRLSDGNMEVCVEQCSTTHITDIANWGTDEEEGLCVSACPDGKMILENATLPKVYCLTSCAETTFSKEFIKNGDIYCTESCLAEVAQPGIIVVPGVRYHYTHLGRTHCVSKCPDNYKFIDSPQNFNSETEHGECKANCDHPRFKLTHPSLIYPDEDETPKEYCNIKCFMGDFLFHYTHGEENLCTNSCISPLNTNVRYKYRNDLGYSYCVEKCSSFIKEVQNFNLSYESGTCEDECSELTFQSDEYKWPDNSNKTFCVSECTFLDETHPYVTQERKCVDSCQEAGFAFTMEDKTCSDNCSAFIFRNIYCVLRCPDDYPLVENQHCVKKCSPNNPLIKGFRDCSNTCANLLFEDLCVDQCDSQTLIQYLSAHSRPYIPKSLILNRQECSTRCSESNYPYVNEVNNRCISSCPPPCDQPICSFKDIKYKDAAFYCREKCSDPTFPLTDNDLMECLVECKQERPYILDKHCLEECPQSHSLIAKRSNCENAVCGSECSSFSLFCVDKCPLDLPFTLTFNSRTECVCQCPRFFIAENRNCVLFCDPQLGLVNTEDEMSCEHCFKDKGGLFFYQGHCVVSCPLGTAANQNHVCTPCFDLNLWENENQRCIPFSKCEKLSYFDFEKKTCTACNKKGYMITKRQAIFACEKTNCQDGFVSQQTSQPICVICAESEFFADPDCIVFCPEDLSYDFPSRRCLSCSTNCACCSEGRCKGSICECNPNSAGRYCSTKKQEIVEISTKIINFLNRASSTGSLKTNENDLILEVTALYSAETRMRNLGINPLTIFGFMKNIYSLLSNTYIEYSYQTKIFDTLDKLLALAAIHLKKTQDSTIFDKALQFLYDITDKIQIFNVTMTVIPDFEQLTSGRFDGTTFTFSFGTDLTTEDQIDMTTCLGRMRDQFNLPDNHKFPYRIIKFKSPLETVKPKERVFVASSNPLMMLWLYLPTGIIDVNEACEEKFIDVSFQVELPLKDDSDTAQKINLTGINVFNKQDPFFNDRCVPASDGTDLTIAQRKEKLFVDSSSVCAESPSQVCQIQGVDENNQAKCACRGIQNKRKSSMSAAFSSYPKSNYILVTCVDTFKEAILLENLGFYTITVPCLLAIILIFFFNTKIDAHLTDRRRFQYMRTDIELFDPDCMDPEIYFDECFDLQNRLDILILGVKQEINFDFSSLPSIPDLSHLSIKEQLRLDHRSNWQYTKDIFISQSTFCYTFFSKSLIDPKPFLILLYVSELNMNVMLNSFFIDDDLVESFNESEDSSIISSFIEELPKTIWALLTTKLFMGILTFFYSFNSRAVRLFLKRLVLTKDESAVKAYNLFLNDHTWRLVSLSVLAVPFNLFCMYFVVVYCEVYANSTGIWLNGIMMGLFIDNVIVQGIPAVFLVVSRAIAKKYPKLDFIFVSVLTVKALISLNMME